MFNLTHLLKNKKLVIFDIDDTIYSYNQAHEIALNKTLNKFNFSIEDYNEAKHEVKQFINGTNQHKKELYFKKLTDNQNLNCSIAFDMFYMYQNTFLKNIKVDTTIKQLIKYCKENEIKLCALTNFYFLEQVERLNKVNLLSYFDKIITSEELDIEKPNPLLYYHVLNMFNVNPSDVIMIGDSLTDIPPLIIDYYPYNCNNYFFSVCGKSGCGKSTLSLILKEIFGSIIIEGDSYHKYERHSDMWNILTHYDYQANNIDKMNNDVKNLFYQKEIMISEYNHSTGLFSNKRKISYKPSIIFEGLHFLNSNETNKFFRFKIFIDNEYANQNKIKRDTKYRGKNEIDVITSIQKREDDYQKYILSQKENANIIFNQSENKLNIIFTDEFDFIFLKNIFEKIDKDVIINQNKLLVSFDIKNNIREFRPIIMKIFNQFKRNFYE